jgi:hypothetical protein
MPNNRPPIFAPDSARTDFGEEPIFGVLPPIAVQAVVVSAPQPNTSPQSSAPQSPQADTPTK